MKLGRILAAAAIVVALPRHIIAALHAGGFGSPDGFWYPLILIGAGFWAVLEALTVFHLWNAYSVAKKPYLVALILIVVISIAITNAPSLVADSAGLKLTQLLPVAGIAHWVWSISSIAGNLIVVLAAGAADAAIDRTEEQRRIAELTDSLDKAASNRQNQVALDDFIARNGLQQEQTEKPGATHYIPAKSEVTATVKMNATETSIVSKSSRNRNRETVAELLKENPEITATEIASRLGVTRQAISKSVAWRNRSK